MTSIMVDFSTSFFIAMLIFDARPVAASIAASIKASLPPIVSSVFTAVDAAVTEPIISAEFVRYMSKLIAPVKVLSSPIVEAVAAVKISQDISNQTVEQTSKADDSLSEIDKLMELISEMNTQIARATEQQTQAADEVNLRINDLAGMVDESLATSVQLNDASVQLESSSNSMSEVVSRFKF